MTLLPDDAQAHKQGVAAVFDRGADVYDQLGVDFFTPAARDLVDRAGVGAGERVLDVGTGRGAVLFAAAAAVGDSGHVVGIDLAPRMLELTGSQAAERRLHNVTAVLGDAERPDFPDGAFDAVLAGLVIFFLPDPAAALRRYAALLSPGGRIGFSTFAASDPVFEAAMRTFGRFVPGDVPARDERQGPFGSPDGIRDVVTANGFLAPGIDEAGYVSRFRDADHWLAWVWSHGGRSTLERVPPDRLEEATEAATAVFEAARTPEGSYAIETRIRFTVAQRA